MIGVQNVAREDTDQYGIVRCGSALNDVYQIDGIVEKPKPAEAPSTLGVVGRYILSPRIFEHLANVLPGKGGEIQLTDAMARMIGSQPFHAVTFTGRRFDCGSKAGFVEATLSLALERPDMADDVRDAEPMLLDAPSSCVPLPAAPSTPSALRMVFSVRIESK